MMEYDRKATTSWRSSVYNTLKTGANLFLFMWSLSLEILWKMIGPVVKPILSLLKPITNPIVRTLAQCRDWIKNIANDTNAKLNTKLSAIKPHKVTPEFIQSSVTDSITWIWNRAKETSPFQTKPTTPQVESNLQTRVTPPRLG